MFYHLKQFFTLIPKILPPAIGSIMLITFAMHPEATTTGASRGMYTWWHIIVPSLLPFFIMSEFLVRFGVVHFGGTILEPIMRPLFNVPGVGAFPLIMGSTSGAPVNGSIIASLRYHGLLTKSEGNRLLIFTSNSSLLFMISAIPVGMLNQPELGVLIAGTHLGANLMLGVAAGFASKLGDSTAANKRYPQVLNTSNILSDAFKAMKTYLGGDNGIRSKCYDIVYTSMVQIFFIGGYIIFFSVTIELTTSTQFIDMVEDLIHLILPNQFLSENTVKPLLIGLLETTIGTEQTVSNKENLLDALTLVAFLLGWGGLSVHAQISTVIAESDLSLRYFFIARLIHGLLAGVLIRFLILSNLFVVPSFAMPATQEGILTEFNPFLQYVPFLLIITLLLIISMMVFSLIIWMIKK